MRVAVSGWFSGRAVGSGRYTDQLVGALRARFPDDRFEVIGPNRRGGNVSKVVFEQVVFPRLATAADVAHVPYWAPPLRPSVPLVVTVHDLIPVLLPEYRARLDVRAYIELVRRATTRAAAVLVDSASTASDVLSLLAVDETRVQVVPLGVGPEFHPPVARLPATDRQEPAEVDPPERYGLYVGGFDQRKNLAVLLEAWADVYRQSGVPLVVAGRLPPAGAAGKPHPAALARRVGLVDEALLLPGEVSSEALVDLYRRASVFAYPSRYEGFGLPPLEAMACGAPVVAARATSLPEVVGDAGLLVDPDDVDGWAAALLSVLLEPGIGEALSAAGPARAARFTWEATAGRTHAVYAAVAA